MPQSINEKVGPFPAIETEAHLRLRRLWSPASPGYQIGELANSLKIGGGSKGSLP